MKIEYLEIKGFKSIEHIKLENVTWFSVFAGANGSGKSNLMDALDFFSSVIKYGANQAISDFGGIDNIYCLKLNTDNQILFSIKVIIDQKIYHYILKLENIYEKNNVNMIEELFVDNENLSSYFMLKNLNNNFNIDKLQNLFNKEQGKIIESFIKSEKFHSLQSMLKNIEVFRIDAQAIKLIGNIASDPSRLLKDASNLAIVINELEKNTNVKEEILEYMSLFVPNLNNIQSEKQTIDGSIHLLFQEDAYPKQFPAYLISDGTVYILAILVAILLRKDQAGITIIEEPERGIHPKAIEQLVYFMREHAHPEHLIFVTTHSESVVRASQTDELWFTNKENGSTQIINAR